MARQDETRGTRNAAAAATDSRGGRSRPLIASNETLDRAARFHLGAWGFAAVAALAGALLLARLAPGARWQEAGEADLVQRQAHLLKQARDGQNEARRLSAALDVLSADRDRLYARVTALEQEMESVTGSVAQQARRTAAPPPTPSPPAQPSLLLAATSMPAPMPPIAMPEIVRATPPVPAPAVVEPPPPSAPPETAKPAAAPAPQDAPDISAPRTEFGIDLGGAGSVDGLRALWSGMQKAHGATLDGLRPIMMMKERHGGQGLQLRLIAGPFADAAAAARLCATLATPERPCETALFDGQRLAPRPERTRSPRAAKRNDAKPQASAF
ncbi:MAG: hypothetical protein EPO23_02670 [Xanthobacteraceae bacterium]|nr:MAG: hypothetical protein EPO23_02670 [Xanthobacteraceae bacterium]